MSDHRSDDRRYGIGFVVLDLDQHDLTRRCLRSLAGGTRPPEAIVLVENGRQRFDPCDDPSLRALPITVLHPGRNLGCPGGRNLGLDHLVRNTEVATFVLIDNDTVAPAELVERLANLALPRLEVAAPLIRDLTSGAIWSSGGRTTPDGAVEQLSSEPDMEAVEVDWAPGACLAMGHETWRRIGEFDSWLHFLFEDIEWCERLRRSGGRVVVRSDLVLFHDPHHSLGDRRGPQRTHLWARNGTVFRIAVMQAEAPSVVVWLVAETIAALRDLVTGHPSRSAARMSGLVLGLVECVRRQRSGTTRRPNA